jgi:hypothetical protein
MSRPTASRPPASLSALLILAKSGTGTSRWRPLEEGSIAAARPVRRVRVLDGGGRAYLEAAVGARPLRFRARGHAGLHRVLGLDAAGEVVAETAFRLAPATAMACDRGIYAACAERVANALRTSIEPGAGEQLVAGRVHRLCVSWLRDHANTLKAMRHFWDDVTSGTGLFLRTQQADGMVWDDINRNRTGARSWFGEALGDRYHAYYDDGGRIMRRIPVEADVEYLLVEAVHHGWQACGDDAWMAEQLPRLEKALAYTTGSPLRWSRRHGLVKRAYTMDSWDFKHPDAQVGGGGDHRCLAGRDQPFFLFHGDNSGLYAAHLHLAAMHAALGRRADAGRHRRLAAALRRRANALLWRDPIYAHLVPERPMPGLKARVGDDDRRISLSLPYTVNRGLPDPGMAVRIIDEYRRRGREQAATSFAEWWAMDPMYLDGQWGDGNPTHQTPGEYMNGGISPLVAGELARAAFTHGREGYGADILRRLWRLSEADGGRIHDTYRRLPPDLREPGLAQRQRPVDLRRQANVGLRHRARRGVAAWTGEGDNDLRGLPPGRRRWLEVAVAVIDPALNRGRAVVALGGPHPASVTVPWRGAVGCLYAVHALAGAVAGTAGWYDLVFADGSEERFPLVAGRELANWWNPQPLHRHGSPPNIGRVCWRGPNPVVGDVGVYLSGFTNPRPHHAVTAIRLGAAPGVRLMVVALTVGGSAARLPRGIRSFGLPAVWSQAAVHNALVEGLAGVEDGDRAFAAARIAPRWAATEAGSAAVCVHYPASDGYCAYRWRHLPRRRLVEVDATGSFRSAVLRVLMPAGQRPRAASLGGRPLPLQVEEVEDSHYAVIALDRLPDAAIAIAY